MQIENATALTLVLSFLATTLAGFFTYRGARAMADAERAKAAAELNTSQGAFLLQQQQQLSEEARKSREDLTRDNVALRAELQRLWDELDKVRERLRDCMDRTERRTGADGHPEERRRSGLPWRPVSPPQPPTIDLGGMEAER